MTSRSKAPGFWLGDLNKKSLINVRITGVNLQGTGQTGFLMFKKETFVSVYTIECKLCSFRWVISKTFEDFIELFDIVHSNAVISAKRNLTVSLFALLLF